MTGQPLDFIPMWALYLLTVLAMLATMEAGYRLTKARQRKSPDRTDTSVGAISGASLALLVFLLAFVPVVGPFTNIFVIGAVALVQGSTTLALHPVALAALAVVINLIFVAIVAELILPKIWGSAVSLPTIVIIPGVVIGAALLGPLGALISVPILGFCADLVGYTIHKIRGGDPYPGEPEPVFFQGLF